MAKPVTAPVAEREHTVEEHLPEGKNPQNDPVPGDGLTAPQPKAPEQTPVDLQQDQQPVDPVPLLEHVEEKGGKQRELRNG